MLFANGLLESAKREAGLDDYGDMGFAEGLRVLVDSVNREAGLTPEHEEILKNDLLRVLVNRLRMQRDLVLHPEILAEVILPPVFITSMPRTGSTKLHRLMAATGEFNAMTFWHSHDFARIPGAENVKPDPRIASAESYLQWLYKRAPGFQQGHPMYTEEAEEEVALLDAGFNSIYRYAAALNVPSYVQWVLGRDGLQAYRDLRRMLQYLQWQHFHANGKRWLLKTPSLFGMEGMFAQIFPGMNFIVAHRHPADVLASACALCVGVRQLYSDKDVSAMAGPMVLFNAGEMAKGHLHWREHYPADKVIDVRFDEVMGDEIVLLERIFSVLGMTLSDADKARVHAWIEMDARREHQRNTTPLADYGLTAEAINERLSGYIERYKLYLRLPAEPR
jgi:hypothetical protein